MLSVAAVVIELLTEYCTGRSLEEIDLVFMKHETPASHTPSWIEDQRSSENEEKVAVESERHEKA